MAKSSVVSDSPAVRVVCATEILSLEVPEMQFAIHPLITKPGLWLVNAVQKTGKTLLSAQMALSISAAENFLGKFSTDRACGMMMIEQDDPSGIAALKPILARTSIPFDPERVFSVTGTRFSIEPGFIEFLEHEIAEKRLGVLVLDSYTALRGPRNGACDLVKAESIDLGLLDELAKRTGCLIFLIHHASKGSAALDWSDRAAGTYAMGAHSEGQVFIQRFHDLPSNAPERLVQIRGRHVEGAEMVIRFREATLDFELVLEGGAAPYYPAILQIQENFERTAFTPKQLCGATGMSRATAMRVISRLLSCGAARRVKFGEYRLEVEF